MTDILDSHVHLGSVDDEANLLAICQATGIARMALASIQNAEAGAGLPQSLYMKARHPDGFLVFAGLNHAERLSGGKVKTASLAEQVAAFAAMGCDGIKMIEGKPTWRQTLDIPPTDPYFAEYWAAAEASGLPVLWHVNDPEEFWDPELVPDWAKVRGWGYGPEDVAKEDLYVEVAEVLARHPGLKVDFAHFYFLSADLPRAARFLEEHPNVNFDLAPGVEMLTNISRDPEAGREFFVRFADRIVFGTDIWSGMKPEEAVARAGMVFRWLESDDTFGIGDDADYLLGVPESSRIRGMSLPDDVLARIYGGNLGRMLGPEAKALDIAAAVAECERIAAWAEGLSGRPAAETEAGRVAGLLGGD
jgi:predicted TIM-barrel fold metal-dependent hydrolase